MYAVIKTGGKQYKVASNDVIKIEKIDAEVGKTFKFDQVLAIGTANGVEIGAPTVAGAVITAEVLEQKKDDKIIVFKKKRRQNYRRKNGHRQQITVVRILDVSGKGEITKAAPKKKVEKAEVEAAPAEAKKAAPKKETAAKKPAAKKSTKKED
jgi:large subunit ribosomal protein L21